MVDGKSQTRSYVSLPYQQNKNRPSRPKFVRGFILCVILSMIVIVIISVVCLVVFNPERQVKSKINSLAATYYEDYFYPKITKDPATVLKKYENTGLSQVTLRQLLFDPSGSTKKSGYILAHCDENKTYVKYYPEPPYSKTSYRTEINYSCDF